MHEKEIAHNVIFVKCEPFVSIEHGKVETDHLRSKETSIIKIRVVICPKKPSYGKLYNIWKYLKLKI